MASLATADTCEGSSRPQPAADAPLCVDLDGSLLAGDSLHEGLLAGVVAAPRRFAAALGQLGHGKAAFKRAVAALTMVRPDGLPYNLPLLTFLQDERAKGREIALYSAADQSIVDAVASHLDVFDYARGSDGRINLSGPQKLAAIRERYGDHFVYVGNDAVDLPIWQAAKAAVVVGDAALVRRAGALVPIEASFTPPPADLKTWIKALRLHQWAKNGLIFAPIVLAGPLAAPVDYVTALFGFVVLGLLASVGYVVNDLLDLAADRRHDTKRHRPFAAGRLTPKAGVTAAAAMFAAATVIALALSPVFAAAAAGYFTGTLSYSLKLKRVPMLDVLVLAGLFTVRVVAGTTLTVAPFSYWLITFSLFLFLSLALVKRYAELVKLAPDNTSMRESRGYTALDLPLLLPFGAGSALAAGMIFVVYLVEERFPSNIYSNPGWLWFIFPVLMFWLLRMWRLAVHGRMDDDPVLFALKDRVSLGLGAAVLGLVLLAW